MAVEIYLGRLFRHGHERRAFGLFVQDLVARFASSDELYIVVAEVDANTAAMDLLLLSARAIIIADFKELTAAHPADAAHIHISGKENGQWQYSLPGRSDSVGMGGLAGRDKNPYKQMDQMRRKFAEWLAQHAKTITGESWSIPEALRKVQAWAVISPGFDEQTNDLDLPWEQIADQFHWFKVIPLTRLAWEFNCASSPRLEFTARQMQCFMEELGVQRVENLAQILPGVFSWHPQPPASFLFSRPPLARNLVGRACEQQQLNDLLADPLVSLVCLQGLGGTGKSALAAACTASLPAECRRLRWVECAEKDLTLEALLAAAAAELHDPVKTSLLLDKEGSRLVDRLDAALDYFESEGSLLVFDDYHKVQFKEHLEPLFTRVAARSASLKILLLSREHPEILDCPALPPGAARKIVLEGIQQAEIQQFFAMHGDPPLTFEQLHLVWERTRGNPYAMGLLRSLARKYGWGENVASLRLYQDDRSHWFDSLMDTTGKEARELAARLSVIRSPLTWQMIAFLAHDPQAARQLVSELLDNFILQPGDQPESYQAHEFVREYLYDHLPAARHSKAHLDAGKHYQSLAAQSTDDGFVAEALFEAIYHFDQAGAAVEIQSLASTAFTLLDRHGDSPRAHSVAHRALKAARHLKAPLEISRWLLNVAGWEMEHDQNREARQHLRQALEHLPTTSSKTGALERQQRAELETQIYLEMGRFAYSSTRYESASQHFQRALESVAECQNPGLRAECLMRIGRLERQRDRLEDALANFQQVSQIASQQNDLSLWVQAVSHMGLIARQQQDFTAARQHFSAAIETAQSINDWRGVEINRSLLADLARRQENYAEAAEIFSECLEVSRRIGSGVGIRVNMGQLAETLIYLGELEQAEQMLAEVEERASLAEDGIGLAWTLRRRGLLLKQRGDESGGNALIQQGIAMLKELGSLVYLGDFERDLAPLQPRLPGM